MSDENQEKMIAQQKADQAWAYVRGYFKDIDRIADEGPNDSEDDRWLSRKLAQLVRGEIAMRILDSEGR